MRNHSVVRPLISVIESYSKFLNEMFNREYLHQKADWQEEIGEACR